MSDIYAENHQNDPPDFTEPRVDFDQMGKELAQHAAARNLRNAILESAALVAEQIDDCNQYQHDNGFTEDGYRQARRQIAEAIRNLKL